MKSFTLTTALLASAAMAQPHRNHARLHHEERALVVEVETVYETATVIVGDSTTRTIFPETTAEPTTSSAGGEFFQPASTTSSTSTSTTTTPTSTYTPPPPPPTTEAAPAPTTTEQPAPAPTTTSTTQQAQPTSPAGGNQNFGLTKESEITYYNIGLGSCGYEQAGLDKEVDIVAVPHAWWDSISSATNYGINMPAHPLCNRKIVASSGGKDVTLTIKDRCGGCEDWAIDVSEKPFLSLFGNLGIGRTDVTWSLVGEVPTA